MTTPEKQGEEFVTALRAFADAKYVRGCEIARADACLGAEYKLDNGKFGFREFAAHKNFNEHMGAYFAIQEFLKENAHLTAHAQQQAAVVGALVEALAWVVQKHDDGLGIDGRVITQARAALALAAGGGK